MVVLLPWLIAAGSAALALWLWARETPQTAGPKQTVSGRDRELRELRLALAVSASEAAALREELDRLLGLYQERLAKAPAGTSPAPTILPGAEEVREAEEPPAELTSLAKRYGDALLRSLAGDEAASNEAFEQVMELLRAGPAAFPALRDAYLSISDPRARAIISRAFLTTMGPEAREFVAERLAAETDPKLREELALRAARMTTPAAAIDFRDPLLGLLQSDASVAARAAAVHGLRYLRNDEEVDTALLAAASDSAAEVRAAALEQIASRPRLHEELRRLLTKEGDPDVRAVGECRLLLTDRPFR